jgi:hypothetical protein
MKIETVSWRAHFKTVGGETDPTSMVMIPGGTRCVRFSKYPAPFITWQRICGNLQCKCRELVMGFIETEEDGRSKKGLVFDVPIDVDSFTRGRNERLKAQVRGTNSRRRRWPRDG